jgi:hypothetical protein
MLDPNGVGGPASAVDRVMCRLLLGAVAVLGGVITGVPKLGFRGVGSSKNRPT